LSFLFVYASRKAARSRRPEPGANTHGVEIVEHGFAEVREGAVATIFARIKPVRITRFGQQLLRFGRIVDSGWRLPVEFEAIRDDAVGNPGVTERQRFIDGLAVDSETCGSPHPLVVPWRLGVPLLGEVEPGRQWGVDRFEGKPRSALQLLGEFAANVIRDVDLAALEGG
jgi:hypothetical protein